MQEGWLFGSYGAAALSSGSASRGHRRAAERLTGPIGVSAQRHVTKGNGFTRVYLTPWPNRPISKHKIKERISLHLVDAMESYDVSATVEFPSGDEQGVLVTFFPKQHSRY